MCLIIFMGRRISSVVYEYCYFIRTDDHVYKMYLYKHKWFPGTTQCGWGHTVGCSCAKAMMHDLTEQPELYDLVRDPYEDHDPISPETDE